MSGQILQFSTPSPRAEAQADTYYQRELLQVAQRLAEAAAHLMPVSGMTPQSVRPSFDQGVVALEAALFHALTLQGSRNADLALRRELARREAERGQDLG